MEIISNSKELMRSFGLTNSLMEKATLIFVLLNVPNSFRMPGVIAAASRMGGALDDCFDKVQRRYFFEERVGGAQDIATQDLWNNYLQSWLLLTREIYKSQLSSESQGQVFGKCISFSRRIECLEIKALEKSENHWVLENEIAYRKHVCLEWAQLFASLTPNNSKLERKAVRKLYFGSVVYQLVCDWTGKDKNHQMGIPGLGSLGSNALNSEEAWDVIRERVRITENLGFMSPFESCGAVYILPLLRSMINKLHRS